MCIDTSQLQAAVDEYIAEQESAEEADRMAVAWLQSGARAVSWSEYPCLCKDEIGNSTLRHCPACVET